LIYQKLDALTVKLHTVAIVISFFLIVIGVTPTTVLSVSTATILMDLSAKNVDKAATIANDNTIVTCVKMGFNK
jgi:hypothetical protein